jgi:hypothetical protein
MEERPEQFATLVRDFLPTNSRRTA